VWRCCTVDPSIVATLREGGLVLYMRHTSTDFSQNDAAMTSYEDCAHQRNLTEKGRAEAREIGAQLKRLAIPWPGPRQSVLPHHGNGEAGPSGARRR
jgi:hypothetical protein